MEDRTQLTVNGQELQQSDVNNLGKVSALADDRVLAEILRLAPYNGTVAKAVVPSGYRGIPSILHGIVRPAGNSGAVCVNPFRAVVGSRATVAAVGAKDNWRDIRSAVFVNATGASNDPTLSIGGNASGNPRWDLVYAIVSVDANGPSVTRYVKNPTSLSTAPQSLVSTLVTTVTVAVQAGTAGATPVRPTAPADTSTSWNIPLAYVRVPTGFTGTSAIQPADINIIVSPATPAGASGAASCRVATCNSQPSQMTTAIQDQWGVAGGQRPVAYAPSDMIGATELLVFIDQVGNSIGFTWPPSHVNGSLVDNSIDWTKRYFRWQSAVLVGASTTSTFDHNRIDVAPSQFSPSRTEQGLGGSFTSTMGSGLARVVDLASATYGLYVDLSTGNLRYYTNGTATGSLLIWLTASGQYSNSYGT